jgi:hypothetical protein
MQWIGKEMKAFGSVIVSVFASTLLKPSGSQRIPFTEALLFIKYSVHYRLMAQYLYSTEPTIVGTDLSAVITWVGLGLCAAEPHAL